MNVLVVTSEPVSAAALRDAMTPDLDPRDVQIMVVAPALHANPLQFWLSDADEAIERAKRVSRATISELSRAGVPASADTGEGDPLAAIEDALRTFAADRIVIFAHAPDAAEHRFREDLDPDEVCARFGLPVDRALV